MKPTHARPLDQAKVHEAQPRKRSPENSNSHGAIWKQPPPLTWCKHRCDVFLSVFFFMAQGVFPAYLVGDIHVYHHFNILLPPKVLFVCWPILLGSTYCILVYSFCVLLWPKSPRSGSKGPTLQRSGPQQILLITLVPVASPPWRFSLCGRRTWKKWAERLWSFFFDAISFLGRGRL